ARSYLVSFQPFELPHRPSNQRFVEVLEDRIKCRWIKAPVISNPAPQEWIVQTSDILQVQFRSVSVVQPPRGLPHGLESRCTDSGREAHKQTIPSTIFHDPWSKGIPKEVKLRIRVMSFTTSVLAIDDMRLVWMHFEAARRKTIRKRHLDGISLHFGFAMYQSIVSITAPRNTRVPPCHPDIERVMQKEIGQGGTDDTPLWSSLGAIHQGSIRKLKRRYQPSPDVKPHPFAGRVFLQRPQQQLMRDVVKQALDVELQNPIVLPASLARHLQGIERRLAGPITVGVWKKDGFQNRFKDCFDDHLRYPIRHRRHTPSELHSLPIDLGDRRPSPIPFIPYVGERLRF